MKNLEQSASITMIGIAISMFFTGISFAVVLDFPEYPINFLAIGGLLIGIILILINLKHNKRIENILKNEALSS